MCVCVLHSGCSGDVRVRAPVCWEQSEGRKRQGQSDPHCDCGDERSFHFGCLDNGDFSPLDSISSGFRLYKGNYFLSWHVKMVARWLHITSKQRLPQRLQREQKEGEIKGVK